MHEWVCSKNWGNALQNVAYINIVIFSVLYHFHAKTDAQDECKLMLGTLCTTWSNKNKEEKSILPSV